MKDLLKKKANELDEKVAIALDLSREKTAGWLSQYTRLIGLGLLIGIPISITMRLYLVTLILACTLHLQIVIRYSYRTAEGIDLWTNQKTQPKTSEPGSKQPPTSVP